MPSQVGSSPVVSLAEFEDAAQHVSRHAYHTPLLTSRLLSERTGFDMRLKAEMFQKGGSYKVRGPLRSEEHTSELQSQSNLVCRLLLDTKTPYPREQWRGWGKLVHPARSHLGQHRASTPPAPCHTCNALEASDCR